MKAFDYHKPNSVGEAVALLASGSESQPIAGGMTLLPTIKQRLAAPGALIDLSGIAALKGINASAGAITIGAMTRHVDVATSPNVTKSVPGACAARGQYRRPGGAQSRHHRGLARQQRPGGRLSGGRSCTRRDYCNEH